MEGGVYENQPTVLEDVVRCGDQPPEQLPEGVDTRTLRQRFLAQANEAATTKKHNALVHACTDHLHARCCMLRLALPITVIDWFAYLWRREFAPHAWPFVSSIVWPRETCGHFSHSHDSRLEHAPSFSIVFLAMFRFLSFFIDHQQKLLPFTIEIYYFCPAFIFPLLHLCVHPK